MTRPMIPVLILTILTSATVGQQSATPSDPAAQQARPLAPGQALGWRSRAVQNAAAVGDVVVLVPNEDAYLQALALWSPQARFPVLIETDDSREDVARFIRAFRPGRVLRFETTSDDQAGPLRERIESTLHSAWDVADADEMRARWAGQDHLPLGAVILNHRDPTWPAAIALAAGRGQILIWSDLPRRSVNGDLSTEHLEQLLQEIETGLDESGHEYRGLGNELDALTICLHISGRYPLEGGEHTLALTDMLGRHQDGRRYAYAGWIFADAPATAAYRAMCALFLHPESALLFDSYSGTGGWAAYAVDQPAERLAEAGFETQVTSAPGGTLSAWQAHARGGISVDFVHINTMGHQIDFQLAGGTTAWSRDVPVLNRPALVHLVHSWAAASPGTPDALAGRWLANGSYALVGAVHEPYLGAFFTPTDLVNRLLAGFPIGAAIRHDQTRPWKVQMIGDPLFTIARQGDRVDADALDLPGESVAASLQRHLRSGNVAEALKELTLLGRDTDAAALLVAALAKDDAGIDRAELVWIGLGALHRAGGRNAFREAFVHLGEPTEEQARSVHWRRARDLLWSKLGTPASAATDADLQLLARHQRWRRPDIDAARIAEVLAARGQVQEGRALLREALDVSGGDEQARRRLQRTIERLDRARPAAPSGG